MTRQDAISLACNMSWLVSLVYPITLLSFDHSTPTAATVLSCFFFPTPHPPPFLVQLTIACLVAGQCGVKAWQLLFKSRSDEQCAGVKKCVGFGVLPWIKDRGSLVVKGKVTDAQTAFSHQPVTRKQSCETGLRLTQLLFFSFIMTSRASFSDDSIVFYWCFVAWWAR